MTGLGGSGKSLHAGASIAILCFLVFASLMLLQAVAASFTSRLADLSASAERVAALELRLKESQATTAAALARIGALPSDLPALGDPASINALLEKACATFDADPASAPCMIEERSLTPLVSEYRARRSGRGSLSAQTALLLDNVAPPLQIASLTFSGGAGEASERLDAEFRIIGRASSAALQREGEEDPDSDS